MKLVRPSTKYKQSFLEALGETLKDDQDNKQMMVKSSSPDEIKGDFAGFCSKLCSMARGENLPKNYVPGTILWLVDDDEFIGQISIRHRLTKKLRIVGGHIGYYIRPSFRRKGYGTAALKLAIIEAKKLGIQKILVTCNTTNTGSKKIIEKNGGIFEDVITSPKNKPKMRFWITPD